MDQIELPCKVEDVISLNLENLAKVIKFLNDQNSHLMKKVNDLTMKFEVVDNISAQFEVNKIQYETLERKQNDIENSVKAHSKKILALDNDNIETQNKISNCEGILKAYEGNINNVNRRVEDNIKSIERLTESSTQLQSSVKSNSEKFENISQEFQRRHRELELKCEEKNTLIGDNNTHVNKKFAEIDNTIVRVIQSISNIGEHIMRGTETVKTSEETTMKTNENLRVVQHETMNKLIMGEIDRINKNLEELGNVNKTALTSYERLSKQAEELNEQVNALKSNFHEISEKNLPMLTTTVSLSIDEGKGEVGVNTGPSPPETEKSRDMDAGIKDSVSKLSQNIRIISQNLGNKSSKDDMEKMGKFLQSEIDKISAKISDTIKSFDSKYKSLSGISSTSGDNTKSFEYDIYNPNFQSHLNEAIKKISKEVIQSEIQTMDLSVNVIVKEKLSQVDMQRGEIDKVVQSIADIKTNLLTNSTEENVKELKKKTIENEINLRKLKYQIEETLRTIEGEEEDRTKQIENIPVKKESVKDSIRTLMANSRHLSDKLERINTRQDSMNTEILSKVKKDLLHESAQILEEFKQDLKISIKRIEGQLRDKVDKFNLDEFGKRFDSKFSVEISKKLDKTDLTRNNNEINKKIDSLENKISKTLVDTIIDLQMDEAPLIVKKSFTGLEKCVSCNQTLPILQQNEPILGNMSETLTKQRIVKYHIKAGKEPLLTEGSIVTEKSERKNKHPALQLPEIMPVKTSTDFSNGKQKSLSKIGISDCTALGPGVPSKEDEERALQTFHESLSGELEKRLTTGEAIIKLSDRAFDLLGNKK